MAFIAQLIALYLAPTLVVILCLYISEWTIDQANLVKLEHLGA